MSFHNHWCLKPNWVLFPSPASELQIHLSLMPSVPVKSHKMIVLHQILRLCISESWVSLVMLPATFLQNSPGPSVTHRYLPLLYISFHCPHTCRPRDNSSSIAVFMSVFKDPRSFTCTVPSVCFIPPGHRDFVTLPFPAQESHLSLCLPPLISLSAPLHPSNLCSNITSSKKSSLSRWPLRHAVSSCHIPSGHPVFPWSTCLIVRKQVCVETMVSYPSQGHYGRTRGRVWVFLPRALSSLPAEDLTNSFSLSNFWINNVKLKILLTYTHWPVGKPNHRCPQSWQMPKKHPEECEKSEC